MKTRPKPEPGEVWKHYKGGRYLIVGLGTDSTHNDPVVIYREINTQAMWVRPLEEFMGRTVAGAPGTGKIVLRFERVV